MENKAFETLSNILALVLEDQPGEAAAALEAVRRKARRDGITGGTLKRIVRQVASQAEQGTPPTAPRTGRNAENPARSRGGQAVAETDSRLRQALQDNAALRWRLQQAEGALARQAERRTLRGLERHLDRADQIELDLHRRTLDLRTLGEELDKQRRQDERRAAQARLARRNNRLGLLLAVMALALVSDRSGHGRDARPTARPAVAAPSIRGDGPTLAL